MYRNIYKKALTITALISQLWLLSPQTTLAAQTVFIAGGQSRTFEINPVLVSGAKVTSVATAQETTQTLFEWGQTFVLEELKRRVLDHLVDQIIQWVQGGGEPKFVTDWRGFLEDVGQAAVGDLAKFLGLGFLCDPFSIQVQLALRQRSPFAEQIACTLDQIVGNIQNFFDNFSNGGFIAYQTMWQPQNNFYGATLLAWDAKEKEIAARTEAARNEALAGGGFLSVKNADGSITTPGSVVGSLVNKAVGSDIDYIVNAQQLQAYIGAIADALINRLIREGVNGITGLGTPKAPRGGSVAPTQKGPCAGLSGATLQSCLNYSRAAGNSFTTARSNILSQINQTLLPRLEARSLINSSIDTLQKYTDDLNKIYIDLFTKQKKISFEEECQKSKNEFQQDILDAIDKEELVLNRLRQDGNNNQTVIVSLELSKNQIETIPQNDWGSLTAAIDNVRGQLDPIGAEDFKSNAQTENSDIKTRTTEKLNSFKKQIKECYE